MSRDYTNYDYLSVSVKSDQLERILTCYRALGWREEKMEDDRQYYNMKYVRLRRPHKIENKDRLQYLQVRMESAINSLSRINSRKHMKSHAFIAVATIIFLGLVALGLWLTLAFDQPVWRIFGWWVSGASAALMACAVILFVFMRKRENTAAADKMSKSLSLIQSLICESEELVPRCASDVPDAVSDDAGEEAVFTDGEEGVKEAENG